MDKGNLHILIGLPGSGKTYWAKEQINLKTHVIDCDTLEKVYKSKYLKKISNVIDDKIYGNYKNTNIILDGLFLTNQSIIDIINNLGKKKDSFDIILHIWDEDRDTCLKNDNGRRKEKSTTIIKNAVFEKIDSTLIKNQTSVKNIKIVSHKVLLKPNWMFFAEKYPNVIDGKLYSDYWVIDVQKVNEEDSGYDYYINNKQTDFEELDELLEKIFPNITYLQYKKMYRNCVSIEEYSDYEYYVGRVQKARYVCDMKKLYHFLSQYIEIKKEE